MADNARFFSHVTSRVVVAVTEGEVGHPQLEEVVARLTSWQVSALERHMKTTMLAVGWVLLGDDGLAVHCSGRPPSGSKILFTADIMWSVFSVDRGQSGRGPAVHVYAALNVGREGWCVLAADFHTLQHVLQEHGMEATHLAGQGEACGAACEERRDALVPRARAGFRHYLRGAAQHMRLSSSAVGKVRALAETFAGMSDMLNTFANMGIAFYCTDGDPEAGWVLVAGFDVRERKHRAAGRTGLAERAVEVVCEEGDERDFLAGVGPLLRRCGQASRNTFLRHFTQINPLPWDEAAAAVDGDGGLRAAAFKRVCGLPLSYLQQHAPHALYSSVFFIRALVPWVAERDLKAPHDVP